jgi:hypothetical protein
MRKLIIGCLLLAVSASVALARPGHRFDATTKSCRNFSEGKLEFASRPWGEGGHVFRAVCKSCHTRENNVGATFLWMESKSSRAWNRIFAEKKVPCARAGAWDSLTMDQMLKLNDYLFRFGLNSGDMSDNA